ncbi:MAG: glycosyltransferase [Syntrophobacteraceae bacterium]
MKITVAICTWNRAKLLDSTLGRMVSLLIPKGVTWELLVVNNNSTDETGIVLASYAGRLPLRTVFEAIPGISSARNRAACEARGDLIVWTDDDVLVDSDWMAAYAAAAAQWPGAAFFGGPIEPWFEGEPPAWLLQIYPKVQDAFAARELGKDPLLFTDVVLPYGANYAIRAEVQRRYSYDRDLGRRPDSAIGGEESAVMEAIIRDGLEGRWVPDARVKHFIPLKRQTMLYLRQYFHGAGLNWTLSKKPKWPLLFGYPRWAVVQVLQSELKYQMLRHMCAPKVWIDDLVLASMLWGYLEGDRTVRKQNLFRSVRLLLRF